MIDYGEEDIDSLEHEVLATRIALLVERLAKLGQTSSFTASLRKGFKVLIVGAPNVGKSSLFNYLVKHERAIVTPLPGTTRDLVSEEIEIEGLPVVLVDSAGVRETDDVVEHMGIQKILEMLHGVDLVLHLVDPTQQETPFEELENLDPGRIIAVSTKLDLKSVENDGKIAISTVTGEGLAELEKEVVIRLSQVMEGQTAYLINQRQEELIAEVVTQLQEAQRAYTSGFGEEVLSSYLNAARRCLGELTGETTVEDILDRMFSNFCLGK